MRSTLSFVSCCLLGIALAACGTARDTDQAGSTFCFGCHSETSELGKKILWAQAGFDHSVHKNGQVERIYTEITEPPDGCAPFPSGGPCFVAVGTEFAGSNAFYANSGGCQMCHTHEGFRKRVAGEYDPPDGSYSIKTSWDTRAQVGSPSTTPNTPLTADVIKFPSPVACFSCHTPHGQGTPDGVTLPQTIPVGTQITTQTGAVWGANKAKGHLCAECHQIRLNNQPTTIASILASVKGTGKFNISAPYGPHHGPQTDMLLGEGGAEYVGTTANGFAFAGAYNNSTHTILRDADCISCHMQDDYSDINVTGSFSVNAAVGGHSFTNKGFVHGQEKALVIGCGSVTNGVGCHTAAGVSGSSGSTIAASNVTDAIGYLQSGDAFFKKSVLGSPATTQNYHLQVNELLSKLASPEDECTGLLMDAAVAAGGVLAWDTMVDQVTTDPRCISSGSTTGVDKATSPLDNNTNASVRLVKALWNYKFIREDKSFGVHNTRYALELLYDSCADLSELTSPGSCGGHTDGQCDACNSAPPSTLITGRP